MSRVVSLTVFLALFATRTQSWALAGGGGMGPALFDCEQFCLTQCDTCKLCQHDKTGQCAHCWNLGGTQSAPAGYFACLEDDGYDCRQCWNSNQAQPDPIPVWPSDPILHGGHALGPVVSTNFEIGLPVDVVNSMVAVYGMQTAELPHDVKALYAPGMHPVKFKFMTQHHVSIWTYNEFWMIAGYLKLTPERAARYNLQNYTGYFQTSPKLYLNATGPTVAGQTLYGMNKEFADIHFTADGPGLEGLDPALPPDNLPMKYTYVIKGAPGHAHAGKTLIRAEWSTKGKWRPASEFTNFVSHSSQLYTCAAGKPIYEFPPGNGSVHKFTCNYCAPPEDAWKSPYAPPFFLSASRIQEATGSFSIDTAFLDDSFSSPGHIPTGRWVVNQSIADSPTGAFMWSNYWGTIPWPHDHGRTAATVGGDAHQHIQQVPAPEMDVCSAINKD